MWDRVICLPFLDAAHSPLISRILWLPGAMWRDANEWGDYCLLKNRKLVADKMKYIERKKQTA
jgi:alpha-1,2-mannosyltransferase